MNAEYAQIAVLHTHASAFNLHAQMLSSLSMLLLSSPHRIEHPWIGTMFQILIILIS